MNAGRHRLVGPPFQANVPWSGVDPRMAERCVNQPNTRSRPNGAMPPDVSRGGHLPSTSRQVTAVYRDDPNARISERGNARQSQITDDRTSLPGFRHIAKPATENRTPSATLATWLRGYEAASKKKSGAVVVVLRFPDNRGGPLQWGDDQILSPTPGAGMNWAPSLRAVACEEQKMPRRPTPHKPQRSASGKDTIPPTHRIG